MRFSAIPRPPENHTLIAVLTTLAATAFAMLVGGALLAALGHNPVAVLQTFFWQPFTSIYSAVEVLSKTTTLALIAIGLAVGFRSGVWNIGAEGQFTFGALTGGAVGLALGGNDSLWALPLTLAAGIGGGIFWALIPALLRTRLRTNEILTSLMLVYVAQLLLTYCVHGPLKNPDGYGFPQSRLLAEDIILSPLLADTRLYGTAFLLPAVAVAAYLLLRSSYIGFQMRVVGLAPRAAQYAGYSGTRAVWISFAIAGALAGLMGVSEVAGPIGQLVPSVSPGYGFTAIIVAFLGRLHPLGIVPAATLMALAHIGGENAQISLGLPISVSGVFQGLVLFCLLAGEFLVSYRIVIKK